MEGKPTLGRWVISKIWGKRESRRLTVEEKMEPRERKPEPAPGSSPDMVNKKKEAEANALGDL